MFASPVASYQRLVKQMALLLTVIMLGGFITPGAADPTTLPLLGESDFTYLGRFALPNGGSTPKTYEYGGYGMAFHKKTDGTKTLFVSGHVYGPGNYGQVQVPTDNQLKPASTSYANLFKATVLQGIADAMEGHADVENNGNPNWSAGILPYNNKLILTAVNSYSFSNKGGHLVRDTLTLSGSGHVKPQNGLYSMTGGASQRSIAGYMFLIPSGWRDLLGGPALTGECCISVISTTSGGPALTVFDPDDVGVKDPIPGINLLYYPTPSTPVDCSPNGSCQSEIFNLTTRVLGGGFVPGSRTVFFVEGHGIGRYCYDTAAVCGDTVMTDVKGPHAQPYRYQILAYDANDLLKVKNGKMNPWEVQPYNAGAPWVLHEFDGEDPRGSAVALDPQEGRLYVRVAVGTSPIIDVYEVTVPVPPSSPKDILVQ
jgi:hypothetical protein